MFCLVFQNKNERNNCWAIHFYRYFNIYKKIWRTMYCVFLPLRYDSCAVENRILAKSENYLLSLLSLNTVAVQRVHVLISKSFIWFLMWTNRLLLSSTMKKICWRYQYEIEWMWSKILFVLSRKCKLKAQMKACENLNKFRSYITVLCRLISIDIHENEL